MIFAEGRSSKPSDYAGDPIGVLEQLLPRIQHLGVKTRIADTVWLLDRRKVEAGRAAVAGYLALVKAIETVDKLGPDRRETGWYKLPDLLRRALQIGKGMGWDRDDVLTARNCLTEQWQSAAGSGDIGSFLKLSALDLDYRVSDAGEIARAAEQMALSAPPPSQHEIYHCAARAYRMAKCSDDAERCVIAGGECLVVQANGQPSAMGQAHWLEQAVAELRGVTAVRDRWRVIKHQLVEVQTRVLDEMTPISQTDDISDLVSDAVTAISGKELFETLRSFAGLHRPPSPDTLRSDALQQIEDAPLSSLFGSTQLDAYGKPVHRTRSGFPCSDPDDEVIREVIARSEKLRRSLISAGCIQPMRKTMIAEHAIDEATIAWICRCSAFVPPARHAIYVAGFLNFFNGDLIAALHLLVPQLENSIRHILRGRGVDVVKINDDNTQEDYGLNQLLSRLRTELEKVFGGALVSDIDNLFVYRGGPQLRDRLSHGLLSQFEPYGPDGVYACWLIFHICCAPLLDSWDEVAQRFG